MTAVELLAGLEELDRVLQRSWVTHQGYAALQQAIANARAVAPQAGTQALDPEQGIVDGE